MSRSLPDGFIIGAATSAFQVEGAADSRGETIWDRFLRERGARDDGLIACDHVQRVEEDLDLMAAIGLDAYRGSISWARVLPEGTGRSDGRGIGFYDRLVDGLLERGIEPWLTLFHWDLPQALQERGGWRSRDTVSAYVAYVERMVDVLGDRVTNWITHNEPWVTTMLGHRDGVFAPGTSNMTEALTVGHHLLLSHGLATQAIRALRPHARVTLALDCRPAVPASDRDEDVEACRHFDGFRNRWFFDPVFGLGYPEDLAASYHDRGVLRLDDPSGPVRDGDLVDIATPIDVLGLNYYTAITVAAGREETDEPAVPPGPDPAAGYTEMGWAIQPDLLREHLVHLHRTYSPPSIVVTENGASFSDAPGSDGRVRDVRRIRYLHDHLAATLEARDAGVPVDGHFTWSLLDNLEWTQGFTQRFGIVWVDHSTQERVVKDSGWWLRDVLHERRLLDAPET